MFLNFKLAQKWLHKMKQVEESATGFRGRNMFAQQQLHQFTETSVNVDKGHQQLSGEKVWLFSFI